MSASFPPSQSMNVNLEFSLPVDLAHIRDADQLHAPIEFAAPLALGFVFIARAFAAAAPPPDQVSSASERSEGCQIKLGVILCVRLACLFRNCSLRSHTILLCKIALKKKWFGSSSILFNSTAVCL